MADEAPQAAACWLCNDLGAVAIHMKASAEVGKVLWVAHRPASTSHPVQLCPACVLGEALGHLRDARDMMARMAALIPDYM